MPTTKQHLKLLVKYILTTERLKKNYWWTPKFQEIVNEKKILYNRWLNTGHQEDRHMYNQHKYMVKKEITETKNLFWESRSNANNFYYDVGKHGE